MKTLCIVPRPLAAGSMAACLFVAATLQAATGPWTNAASASGANSVKPGLAVASGDDFDGESHGAAVALQRWYNRQGLWDSTGWWNAANCVEALENLIVADNGGPYAGVIANTFNLNATNKFLNDYYDDEGWWALAWIRGYDLTGNPRYLEMAKAIFAEMTGGWTSDCGGGMQWRKSHRYKNAIPNELFLLLAVQLHQRTPSDSGQDSYMDWALREWTWFRSSGMINPENLVNDGLTRDCQNTGRTTWTYNQGVILGGLAEMYEATGDREYLRQATAIADAAIATLASPDGILREPCEPGNCGGGDVPQFKGIFIRYLASLYRITRQPAYYEFLARNAHSIWTHDRNAADQLGLVWRGPFDSPDAARQSSALTALSVMAEPATTTLAFAKGAANPAFSHAVGAASGTLAWTCTSSNRAGSMLSCPQSPSLPGTKHTVHFRLAVSATNSSKAALARLEVNEGRTGKVRASREVEWSSFSAPGGAQDFSLAFTNAAGNPLVFQVHWNGLPNACDLTLTDVTLDGSHNWTAVNLNHEIGRLDDWCGWEADPVRDMHSGYLIKGPATVELPAGDYQAVFELKVDNFNWDDSKVAVISVADAATGREIATRDLTRSQFPNALFHPFALPFTAASGQRCEFRTRWIYGPNAPWLTQRSLVVTQR
jgi:predicted alpha-1,6-mannanase (GH76 family)